MVGTLLVTKVGSQPPSGGRFHQKFTFVAWSPLADPRVVLGRSPLADSLFFAGFASG